MPLANLPPTLRNPPGETRKTSLTGKAYADLRHRIITGDLAPGQEISEFELAEQLRMSKTPIREALARLGVERLVETFPRRGYRIAPVTIKDMNDLFAVRGILESSAAAFACETMSEADLDALDRLASVTYVPGETISVRSFVEANEDFHGAIATATGNPRLAGLVISHLQECARFFYMGVRARDVNPETRDDHHRIVEVLRRRDPAAARAAMDEHNENTRTGLLKAFIDGGRAGPAL